jgi:uncharacterized protein
VFDDAAQASSILGTIMGRYNIILREVETGAFGPIFWENADGTVIAADWAEGFLHAVALRADAWEPLMRTIGRTGGGSVFFASLTRRHLFPWEDGSPR